MGNRAVTEVLRRYAMESEATAAGFEPRFDQVVLVAPDVDANVFREEIAPGIQSQARRVTLYASENDKALKVSKGVHGHPRAGDLSSGVVIAGGVETIDATDADTGVFQAVSLGHSYFAEEFAVLTDLEAILKGKTPAQRSLTAFSIGSGLYWKF